MPGNEANVSPFFVRMYEHKDRWRDRVLRRKIMLYQKLHRVTGTQEGQGNVLPKVQTFKLLNFKMHISYPPLLQRRCSVRFDRMFTLYFSNITTSVTLNAGLFKHVNLSMNLNSSCSCVSLCH